MNFENYRLVKRVKTVYFQIVGGFAESGDHRCGGNRPTMDSKSIAFENTM